jgi:hypothetical protein
MFRTTSRRFGVCANAGDAEREENDENEQQLFQCLIFICLIVNLAIIEPPYHLMPILR